MRQRAEGGAATASEAELDEVLAFMRLLWAVDHLLQSGSKRMKALIGVTGPQRLVVRILGQFPELTAGRLAQILHIHPSTLTGVLKRLVERGLIARAVDPQDARRARFQLTEKGRGVDRIRSGTVEAQVRLALGRLPAHKITAAEQVLSAVADVLSEKFAR